MAETETETETLRKEKCTCRISTILAEMTIHMTYKQREMNSLPVILTYFIQGGGKCLFFAITLLLIYNFELLNFIMEKKMIHC
jgi:hypothetical protein